MDTTACTSVIDSAVTHLACSFRKEFTRVHHRRRSLYLVAKSEAGLSRCVCSYIRPTSSLLRDPLEVATLIASVVQHKPLEPPLVIPFVGRTPSEVLRSGLGNSFELSQLLLCFLRGLGVDAYVASGYAASRLALGDFSLDCLNVETVGKEVQLSVQPLSSSQVSRKSGKSSVQCTAKYAINLPKDFVSDTSSDTVTVAQATDADLSGEETPKENVHGSGRFGAGALNAHAWVVVLDVKGPYFIEATTGAVHAIDDNDYLGIESLFNEVNYWVNMQSCDRGISKLSFNLEHKSNWFQIFPGNGEQSRIAGDSGQEAPSDPFSCPIYLMPFSFCKHPLLSPADVQRFLVNVKPQWKASLKLRSASSILSYTKWMDSVNLARDQTIKFANGTLQCYRRPNSMGQRFAFTSKTGHIIEVFDKRTDRLWLCSKGGEDNSYQCQVDEYREGRKDGLQTKKCGWRYCALGVGTAGRVLKWIDLCFIGRADGLVRFWESEDKRSAYFVDRNDHVIYRSIRFSRDSGQTVEKLTEKYSDNLLKQSYFIGSNRIQTIYPHKSERLSSSRSLFFKPTSGVIETKTELNDLVVNYQSDPREKPTGKMQLYRYFERALHDEERCLQSIRSLETANVLSSRRHHELANPGALICNKDDYNARQLAMIGDTGENVAEIDGQLQTVKDTRTATDKLEPFLVGAHPHLTVADKLHIKEAALRSYEETLMHQVQVTNRRSSVSHESTDRATQYMAELPIKVAAFRRELESDERLRLLLLETEDNIPTPPTCSS